MNCSTCHYSRLRGPDHLECRRYSPAATVESFGLPRRGEHPQACWPRIEPTDWCGEFSAQPSTSQPTPDPYDDPLA